MSFAYSPVNITGTTSGAAGAAGTGGLGVTVAASGANYTSVGAATLAGWNIVNIIGNTTESGNINIPSSGLNLSLFSNSTLSMGTNTFQVASGEILNIEGQGTITYGNTGGGVLFTGSGTLNVEDVLIQNTLSNVVCVTNIPYAMFDGVRFQGDIYICGNYNIYSDCIYRIGSIVVQSGVNKSAVHGGVLENVIVIDSGTNTVISDLLIG